MFYCEDCAKSRGWPQSLSRSEGPCEICATHATCYDTPASELRPVAPYNMDLEERLGRAFAKVPIDAPYQDYVHVAINAVGGWLYQRAVVLEWESSRCREEPSKLENTLRATHLATEAAYMRELGRNLIDPARRESL